MEHVLTRQELSIFKVFKLTQADGTRRFITYEQTTLRHQQWLSHDIITATQHLAWSAGLLDWAKKCQFGYFWQPLAF